MDKSHTTRPATDTTKQAFNGLKVGRPVNTWRTSIEDLQKRRQRTECAGAALWAPFAPQGASLNKRLLKLYGTYKGLIRTQISQELLLSFTKTVPLWGENESVLHPQSGIPICFL